MKKSVVKTITLRCDKPNDFPTPIIMAVLQDTPHFAIHHSIKSADEGYLVTRFYSVTHKPTGCGAGIFLTIENAVAYALDFENVEGIDVSSTDPRFLLPKSKELGQLLRKHLGSTSHSSMTQTKDESEGE